MLKYNQIARTTWNKIKKIIEKELDLKINKSDSGKFSVKYITIKYEYNDKEKTLTIELPWIVPKKTKIKIGKWIQGQIDKIKKKK